ncbi:hypothetical protein PspLS_07248 [Pyricularia sp. CBS 133598]|nr:hypothetical protein PspLS_07248 [Pyricularia sp. CBS 133598]
MPSAIARIVGSVGFDPHLLTGTLPGKPGFMNIPMAILFSIVSQRHVQLRHESLLIISRGLGKWGVSHVIGRDTQARGSDVQSSEGEKWCVFTLYYPMPSHDRDRSYIQWPSPYQVIVVRAGAEADLLYMSNRASYQVSPPTTSNGALEFFLTCCLMTPIGLISWIRLDYLVLVDWPTRY